MIYFGTQNVFWENFQANSFRKTVVTNDFIEIMDFFHIAQIIRISKLCNTQDYYSAL